MRRLRTDEHRAKLQQRRRETLQARRLVLRLPTPGTRQVSKVPAERAVRCGHVSGVADMFPFDVRAVLAFCDQSRWFGVSATFLGTN